MSRSARHGPSGEGIKDALAAIPHLARDDLLARWKAAYGRPAPKGVSRRTLEYAAAYEVQAQAYGKLDPAVRRKLTRAMPSGSASTTAATAERRSPAPSGTRLVREWRGRSHTVDVLDDGVLYNGQHYRSLSEVARVITGARWSGPRFFGL